MTTLTMDNRFLKAAQTLALLATCLTTLTAVDVDTLVYDHCGEPYRTSGPFGAPWGAHEGGLHGVPSSYDWAAGARPGYWMDHGGNQAVTSWGQVYEWAGGSPVRNLRIQLRNHRMYIYVGGQWTLAEASSEDIRTARYSEDFTSSIGAPSWRVEPAANGGGISAVPTPGYNIHWWTSRWPRARLPSGYQAFYISCELRLIPDGDPGVDLDRARYLAGVSADSYPTDTSAGHGPWPSLSISRHKFITPQWQTFTAYISDDLPATVEAYRSRILSRPLPPGVTSGTTPDTGDGGGTSPDPVAQGSCTSDGTPWTIPTTGSLHLEAEHYDRGGEGVAWHDLDSDNHGGQLRSGGVDIQTTSDTGGGHNVGWIESGEWLEYTIDAPSAGSYDLTLRVARASAGSSTLHLAVAGEDRSGPVAVPSTGGWQAWTTLTTSVRLDAGEQVLRVAIDEGGFNLNWLELEVGAVPNAAPAVRFTSPTDGTGFTAPAELGVEVAASDADGSVTSVELLLDGVSVRTERYAPWQWGSAQPSIDDSALSGLAAGTYRLEAIATDDQGATARTSISVTVTDAAPDPGISCAINFQPASAPVPAGHLVDAGAAFGERSDGWRYGWDRTNGQTRDRNQHPDQRLDTLNHFMKGGARSWELALPAGLYAVTIDCGDPSYRDQINHLLVEGVRVADPDGADHFDHHEVLVEVGDGRLTIRPAADASNAKINLVTVESVGVGN